MKYALTGEQVEPNAGFWSRKTYLSNVTLEEILGKFIPKPFSTPQEPGDLEFLAKLRDKAGDPAYFAQHPHPDKLTPLSIYLSGVPFTERPPVGAVVSNRPGFKPLVENGMELATLFESETPGLWHRHVFNVLLDQRIDNKTEARWRDAISPPRQALYWHVLDAAIDSALTAVWHFKWLASNANFPDSIRFRQRPSEAGLERIVFDFKVDRTKGGIIRRDVPKVLNSQVCPVDKGEEGIRYPGTPRHPAYGSGHSTYSQAASSVMAHLFKDQAFPELFRTGWQELADNIGEARLWGGVHWRGDHGFGQELGKAVAACIIDRLEKTGVPTPPRVECLPPSVSDLEKREYDFIKGVGDRAVQNKFQIDPKSVQGSQG